MMHLGVKQVDFEADEYWNDLSTFSEKWGEQRNRDHPIFAE